MRIHSPQITGSAENTNIVTTTRITSLSALSASFASTASYWSGSIRNAASASYWSGSIINAATASYVLNAVSASFALTASYISGSGAGVGFPFSGSAIITGSLFVSGSTISGSFKGDGSQITGLTAGGKIHTQTSAASTWTVTHNLGVQYPNVTVYDNNNNVIIPQTIVATDANTLTLTFGSAVAGYAVAGIGGIINVQGRTTQQYFTASTTWSFAHNLGDKYVSLQAFDDAFEMVIPTTIRLVDFTSSLLLFDSASSGYAVATIGGDLPAISSSYAGYTLQVASSAPYSASWVAVPNVTVTTAQTASYANNFTVSGSLNSSNITLSQPNTGSSIDNKAYLRLVNTGTSTISQSIDLVMRWQDGTYNGTGGISMIRESATARNGRLILQPIDSSGNNISAMILTSTGLVELPYGQLKFPASQNASSDANTLDDYEEGTWTPVIRGANTAGTYEISSHYSHYTKIGRQVTVTTRIIMAASITGGGSSYLQVTGLPFAKVAGTEAQGVVDTKGIDTLGNYIVLKFVSIGSTSVVYIYEGYDNGNPTDLPISALSANDELGFTITYVV
jgi:hypothetical protein